MEQFLVLSLFGGGLGSCCVWLSVTWITLCVEELTDGESNRGILVWRVREGQNIRIKLLVPRAILSETVAVSSVFMALAVGMNESPPCSSGEGAVPIHASWCWDVQDTMRYINYNMNFFSSMDVNHGPSALSLQREAFREQHISSKKLMFSKPLLNSTYHLLQPRIESAVKSDVF